MWLPGAQWTETRDEKLPARKVFGDGLSETEVYAWQAHKKAIHREQNDDESQDFHSHFQTDPWLGSVPQPQRFSLFFWRN